MAKLTKLVSTIALKETYVDRLREEFPDLEFIICKDRSILPELLKDAQAFMGRGLTPEIMASCPDLRWTQAPGAGVDDILFAELIDSDIVVTNYSGSHAPNIAEHLLGMMLAFARGFVEAFQHQQQRTWKNPQGGVFELGGQSLAVVGLGDIGQALATRAKCLGMHVTGSRRRSGDPIDGVDRIFTPDELHEMIATADHVAITVPLTKRTEGLFGAAELQLMKSSAYIYNIGRGEIIDQDALIAALENGDIAGAGLDVATPEPLPEDSPLWGAPNLFLTSHYSGLSPRRWDRGIELLVENIRRYRNDETLLNVVDKNEGY